MVVFVDFEQDGDETLLRHHAADHDHGKLGLHLRSLDSEPRRPQDRVAEAADDEIEDERINPNVNSFSASLSCYPVIKRIAQSVDLTTLHSLSTTCRQFRANLMPFRSQLAKLTLHCENECTVDTLADEGTAQREVDRVPRLTSGKIGLCARDMVGECRRCTRVVCRNCCTKPPSNALLKQRLRRLCGTCLAAPLPSHLSHPSSIGPGCDTTSHSFTAIAFQRTPCVCEDSVWLCKPCGRSLANDDATYSHDWTRKTQHSGYLLGLGTRTSESYRGVKCGRGELCLAAQETNVEMDYHPDEWTANQHGQVYATDYHIGSTHYPATQGREGRDEEDPEYLGQGIGDIGGLAKGIVTRRVRIGACVEEHEDERETSVHLAREQSGQDRSWCGWCSRIVLGEKDSIEN